MYIHIFIHLYSRWHISFIFLNTIALKGYTGTPRAIYREKSILIRRNNSITRRASFLFSHTYIKINMHTYTPSRMQIKIYWLLLVSYSYVSFYRKIQRKNAKTFILFFFFFAVSHFLLSLIR